MELNQSAWLSRILKWLLENKQTSIIDVIKHKCFITKYVDKKKGQINKKKIKKSKTFS